MTYAREPVTIVTLSPEEEAAINQRVGYKLSLKPLAGSRCVACNKILEESEYAIRGYASGQELEVCRKCASHVNTPQAIEAAEKEGAVVYSDPVFEEKQYDRSQQCLRII